MVRLGRWEGGNWEGDNRREMGGWGEQMEGDGLM